MLLRNLFESGSVKPLHELYQFMCMYCLAPLLTEQRANYFPNKSWPTSYCGQGSKTVETDFWICTNDHCVGDAP